MRGTKERYPELELRQIDPARGRARRYHMARSRTLFGERAILISWGRIGRPARVRVETFATEAKLNARWRELLARRWSHGYVNQDAPLMAADSCVVQGECSRTKRLRRR